MLAEGDKVPDVTVSDDTGTQVSLRSFKGSWLVLWFYSRDATPG